MNKKEHQMEFIKEPENETENYIFQKNTKTKVGTVIVLVFLGILLIGLVISAIFFGFPEM